MAPHRIAHFIHASPCCIAHFLDAVADVPLDVVQRARIAFHRPALLRRSGCRHRQPQNGVRGESGQRPDSLIRSGEEQRQRDDAEDDPHGHDVEIEIVAQTGANAGNPLILQVSVEFLLGPGLRLLRFGVVGLDPLGTAEDADQALDVGHRGDAVASAAFQQELGHPFLDAFHDLLAARLAQIMGLQVLQILPHLLGGGFLEREGVASDAHFLNLGHFLSASILSTISCQAASISASWARPFSVIP